MKAKFLTNVFRREQTLFKRQGIGFQISIVIKGLRTSQTIRQRRSSIISINHRSFVFLGQAFS